MPIQKLTKTNFEVALKAPLAVVDFWAPWCEPCKTQSEVIHRLSTEGSEVLLGKVDIDKEGDLSRQYKIRAIPTLLFFQAGVVVERKVGVTPLSSISKVLSRLTPKSMK